MAKLISFSTVPKKYIFIILFCIIIIGIEYISKFLVSNDHKDLKINKNRLFEPFLYYIGCMFYSNHFSSVVEIYTDIIIC